ncbi:MAG: amidohydrolase family protein [Vicinamibacterales bacterium]
MTSRELALCSVISLVAACSSQPAAPPAPGSGSAVVYEGARLIPGDGRAAVENAALVVENGTITQVGPAGAITAPAGSARVTLTGKTIMPALIGAHGHVGYQKGLTFLRENYTHDNILDDLRRAAYFGLGTAMTMGIDSGDLVYRIRDETTAGAPGLARLRTAGQGIGGPNAGPGNTVYARGVAFEVTTADEGRAAVRQLAPHKPDMVKIWLDERGGRGMKLQPDVVGAIVDEAGRQGLKVAAHVRNHTDAEVAVGAGVYALTHLARDRVMDAALIESIVARGVYVTPTLSMAERNNYAGAVPEWVREPTLWKLLTDTVAPPVVERLEASFVERDPADAARARSAYTILHDTVARLHAAGARIVLGGDTGLPDHFWGFAEQRELELLVAAGLKPMDAIVAGTSRAAEFLQLRGVGTLAPGQTADFVVLDGNPLEDIRRTRTVARLFLGGIEVDRAAIKAKLTGSSTVTAAP